MLSLGLGGGELHSFILAHFPCIGVDTVDAEPVVIEAAQNYFGFEICDGWINKIPSTNDKDNEMETSTSYRCHTKGLCGWSIKNTNNQVIDTNSSRCRSRVFQYEGLSFVHDAAIKNYMIWSIIIVDLYDTNANKWDGVTETGQSNPTVPDELMDTFFQDLYKIIDSDTGLVIIHYHRDQHYKKYFKMLEKYFIDVIEIPVNENSDIVVASKYHGLKVQGSRKKNNSKQDIGNDINNNNWLCDDPNGDVYAIQEFCERHGYSRRMTMSQRYATRGIYW